MKSLELTLDDRICQIQDNEATIMTSIQDFQDVNMEEHEQTRVVMSGAFVTQQERSTTEHFEIRNEVSEARNDVISSVEATARINRQEYEATRREMELLRKEAEEQAQQLREEIRLLKLEIERSIKEVVESVGKVSAKEQRRLKEHSNAKFNLWVAKDIILKKLLEFLSLFKFNFLEDWNLTMDLTSWKIQTYSKPDPRNKSSERSLLRREGSYFMPKEAERRDSSVSTRISELDSGMTPVYKYIDLHYPIAAGNVAMVKWCLENGASANSFTELSEYKSYMKVGVAEKSPLLLAVKAGSIRHTQRAEIVSLLLEYEADPHSEAGDRGTTLSEVVVKQLPANDRVDPDSEDQFGRTPLSWAVGRGQAPVVKQLLANDRVDPDSKDQSGRTPLSWAAEHGREAVVKQLLANDRVDPDSKDKLGQTPLWWARRYRHGKVIKLLQSNV
ncbi:ankyrin repeat-containing domain protein [Phaeosphaeriaceae sp. PMI808]|nr:ankyrin repeat-containing domain protein [Phaeosphaeriaceae sp. PMI808]